MAGQGERGGGPQPARCGTAGGAADDEEPGPCGEGREQRGAPVVHDARGDAHVGVGERRERELVGEPVTDRGVGGVAPGDPVAGEQAEGDQRVVPGAHREQLGPLVMRAGESDDTTSDGVAGPTPSSTGPAGYPSCVGGTTRSGQYADTTRSSTCSDVAATTSSPAGLFVAEHRGHLGTGCGPAGRGQCVCE